MAPNWAGPGLFPLSDAYMTSAIEFTTPITEPPVPIFSVGAF